MLTGRTILTLFIMFLGGGIAPHFFEPVKLPVFGVHHMHHYVNIIDQDPLCSGGSFMMVGLLGTFLQHFILDIIGDRPDLRLTGSFTDNEKISHCFIDLPEIERHDMLPLLLLDRFNNGFDDF